MSKPLTRPLNERQKMFAREYVKDHNATQAAKRAGYSEKTAYSQGHDLLKHPEVSALIAEIEANILDELGITTFNVIEGIKEIATGSMKDSDRLRALELLGKRLGWAEKVEVQGDVTFTLDIPKPGA